jgi:hypothetical protein
VSSFGPVALGNVSSQATHSGSKPLTFMRFSDIQHWRREKPHDTRSLSQAYDDAVGLMDASRFTGAEMAAE